MMSFMLPRIVSCDYAVKRDNRTKFVFPITGLTLVDKLTIGDVTFYNLNKLDYEKEQPLKIFAKNMDLLSKAKTIVYVDVSNVPDVWKTNCNNNLSIALMLIKQAIGLLYLTYFEYKGFEDQKRIIISQNSGHECEEGMETYLSDGFVNYSKVSDNLWLKPDASFYFLLNKRIKSFLSLYKMDSEMKLKIIKLFESLYYLLNEIHSIERILKMSAFLQLIFLKDSSQSFNYASARIKDLLNQNKIEIDTFRCRGKLNEILYGIYDNIRNKYSHGTINLYEEYNIINASDYFINFQVYMNVILLLAYDVNLQEIQTTKELLSKIENYRP